ncbi:hypothetical protein HDV05_001681, partial [Chytridiales sp. JEL 0842]
GQEHQSKFRKEHSNSIIQYSKIYQLCQLEGTVDQQRSQIIDLESMMILSAVSTGGALADTNKNKVADGRGTMSDIKSAADRHQKLYLHVMIVTA